MWAIEIKAKYLGIDSCDLAYAVYRSFLKYLDQLPGYPSHRCFECENGEELGISHAIELVDADLSEIQRLSGRWSRAAPSLQHPGKRANAAAQVEIYPLGQPPIKVSIDQPPRNEAGILLIGRSENGELRTYCRSKDLTETKRTIVDILSSRTHTDKFVMRWLDWQGSEVPSPWLEGDFTQVLSALKAGSSHPENNSQTLLTHFSFCIKV
jgi:hypothetical protein